MALESLETEQLPSPANAGNHGEFLRNAWYPIAWETEVGTEQCDDIFAREVLGEPIILYRLETGDIAARQGVRQCRAMPLSRPGIRQHRPLRRQSQ